MIKTSRNVLSRTLWLTAALAVPMLASNAAFADEVCGDTTCQKGFVCQSYEMGKCYGTTPRTQPGIPVPVVDGAGEAGGAAGVDLAPGVGAASGEDNYVEPVCESYTAYECVPAPCTVDADCADGMVCHTYTNEMCTGSAVAPCRVDDPECIVEPVEPPVCTTSTSQQCVARYRLPCTTANDCGPGFTCEEQQSCWCSGSKPRTGTGVGGSASTDDPAVPVAGGTKLSSVASGAAASSDGSEDVDLGTGDVSVDPPDCGCAPSGTFACQLQTIACNADADCPSGLLCVDNPSGSCWMSSDGTSGCTTPDPAKVCQPQYYRGGSSIGVGEDVAPTAASGGQASMPPTTSVDTSTGDTGDDEDDLDVGSNGNVRPGQFGKHRHHLGGYGCAVANTHGMEHSGLVSLLLSVGLALGIRRRRSQR